ncbi:hypothetical protein T310_5767 [Rasamsonia emersonii CBS 393.64]|uniref:Uncharacterized protein n=1 Tax=Rasamsonia emersonii (strain ATCC 16479 / CBS 393.64 / IMI 116815) TaxID=1408163 RepID=A0A0F4YRG1_RASE3|nr:hypothetical protein T310_5767 [Rasamsonia emersonii CBS 393.64]KKA20198.1 hypothetical protein T310_5767 [Rasamsonia emersonii CBS 393.64]
MTSFCPPKSILYQQATPKLGSFAPTVTGLSNDDWGDCQARFTVPSDSHPLRIMPIVWRVSTSEVICSVDNQNNAKAMAVSFLGESDSNIIACLDNSEFWWMSPECSEDGWKPFPVVLRDDSYEFQRSNSPRVVDFSPDRSKVALAYRGLPLSVWALDEPGHASWADANEKATKAKTVKAVLETILMYRIPNGDFFVTGGSDGTLRIWDFHHFALVYQLFFSTPITDLAIDPVAKRVHDLRDNFCTVWEQNALIRLTDDDENASDQLSSRRFHAGFIRLRVINRAARAHHRTDCGQYWPLLLYRGPRWCFKTVYAHWNTTPENSSEFYGN